MRYLVSQELLGGWRKDEASLTGVSALTALTLLVCMEYEVEGSRPRGRPKRTSRKVVQKDCEACNLNKEDAMDHGRWKKLIKIGWWSGWWVGECFFRYRLTRVVVVVVVVVVVIVVVKVMERHQKEHPACKTTTAVVFLQSSWAAVENSVGHIAALHAKNNTLVSLLAIVLIGESADSAVWIFISWWTHSASGISWFCGSSSFGFVQQKLQCSSVSFINSCTCCSVNSCQRLRVTVWHHQSVF